MKGIVLTDRVSDQNKKNAMVSYLSQIDQDYEQCTGKKLRFLMIHTDCAGQEKNAILVVFFWQQRGPEPNDLRQCHNGNILETFR